VFEKNLGVRVEIWDPLDNARLNTSQAPADIKTYAAQFGVALGLGI